MASPEPDNSTLGTALLAWVKSFEEAGRGGQTHDLAGLSSGIALWAILRDVDPDYFAASLPEPEIDAGADWTRKWQNLKHVDKQLSLYYRDVCNGQSLPSGGGDGAEPDLKAIAAEASVPDTEKLIMSIIRAAMASPESNLRMGKRLLSLGNENAMAIAYEIRSMEEVEGLQSEPPSRDESVERSEEGALGKTNANGGAGSHGGVFGDPLLEREEELLQAQATIEKLQATHTAAQNQLQELRQEKEQLQEAFDAYRAEINNRGRKPAAGDDFKKLQRQTESDRAYIDDLEGQLQSSRNALDSYERQIQRLKDEGEGSQQLRDDLQMLKTENEDLNQKVKANENLKKKIQALQEQEKTNVSLREEIKQANERLEDMDRLKQVQAALEKEVIEKQGLIRNQEYQINELTTTRKHAEYDARVMAQKLEAARERQDRDHEAIEELRNRLREQSGDADIDIESSHDTDRATAEKEEPEPGPPSLKHDENKTLREKLTLVEQQLAAADARLKQASQRNAALEESNRTSENAISEQQEESQQRLQEQDQLIAELRKELETTAAVANSSENDNNANAPVPPAQDFAALQRENHLMVTAWYDLSARLQNNGVSLGRRKQEPKSWIAKQRALVGPSSGFTGGIK